ncbi:unnamed protein product [Arctogadus glacialis]
MAALASSLIRQRREVKDPQANRQIANKRKPCPKSNKSLCQKQILILISKVRLCGSRGRKKDKRPVHQPIRSALSRPHLMNGRLGSWRNPGLALVVLMHQRCVSLTPHRTPCSSFSPLAVP